MCGVCVVGGVRLSVALGAFRGEWGEEVRVKWGEVGVWWAIAREVRGVPERSESGRWGSV